MTIRWFIRRKSEDLLLWFVWKLPRKLVYWCHVRVVAHATQAEYGNQVVPELTCLEAAKRWDI